MFFKLFRLLLQLHSIAILVASKLQFILSISFCSAVSHSSSRATTTVGTITYYIVIQYILRPTTQYGRQRTQPRPTTAPAHDPRPMSDSIMVIQHGRMHTRNGHILTAVARTSRK